MDVHTESALTGIFASCKLIFQPDSDQMTAVQLLASQISNFHSEIGSKVMRLLGWVKKHM
jgi:hypothetical protein